MKIQPGDEVFHAGEWSPVESVTFSGGRIVIRWAEGGTHIFPESHGITVRRPGSENR